MKLQLLKDAYRGRSVFLTGHTGFKGSWLALFLEALGAKVHGYSLPAPTSPDHLSFLRLTCASTIADIRDLGKLKGSMQQAAPDIVFHLAAQPLVRASYNDPIETYSTNVMGTLHVLEAARGTKGVKAIVNVTSDKCYENREWEWGYRENDPMGGYDPYSSSKGCAELLTSSYRKSYFTGGEMLLASARAGNVIGGGDWAQDRLIPDIVRAAEKEKVTAIRNPRSVRPWQHVLDPLHGYLVLGAKLLAGSKAAAEGWNFGPVVSDSKTVEELARMFANRWPKAKFEFQQNESASVHEAGLLRLDITKAVTQLSWQPTLDLATTVEWTADWYRDYCETGNVRSHRQLSEFMERLQ